jgi:hypothetical protein
MADFTVIPPSTFDSDQPVIGATHLAMYQNLFAANEGSPGAPKTQSQALALAYASGNGSAGSGATVPFVTLLNVSRVAAYFYTAGIAAIDDSSGGERITSLLYQTSSDNGATWSASTTIETVQSISNERLHVARNGIIVVPAGTDAIRLLIQANTNGGTSTAQATIIGIAGTVP